MRSGASEGRIFVEKGKSTLENGKKHYTFAQIREWFRMLAGLLRRYSSGDKAQSEDAAQTKKPPQIALCDGGAYRENAECGTT